MSLLNSSSEENTLNINIDGDDHTTLEVNNLNDSSSGSNSELNSESHSNSGEEPENASHSSLVSDSSSDVMYPSHEVSLCQRLSACAIKNNCSRD